MSTEASSSTHSAVFASVMKYGDWYPLSNCIPSTYSSVVSAVLPSSISTTPSGPTRAIASAIISPISESWFAETVATFR
jgi:hypothetical protein